VGVDGNGLLPSVKLAASITDRESSKVSKAEVRQDARTIERENRPK
jgi:hypothetical protein